MHTALADGWKRSCIRCATVGTGNNTSAIAIAVHSGAHMLRHLTQIVTVTMSTQHAQQALPPWPHLAHLLLHLS